MKFLTSLAIVFVTACVGAPEWEPERVDDTQHAPDHPGYCVDPDMRACSPVEPQECVDPQGACCWWDDESDVWALRITCAA